VEVNQAEPIAKFSRLSLFDLLWLVAGCGVGLGAYIFRVKMYSEMGWGNDVLLATWRDWSDFSCFEIFSLCCLIAVKAGFLPPRQRLEPGYIACFAVLLTSVLRFLRELTLSLPFVLSSMSLRTAALIDLTNAPLSLDFLALGISIGWGTLIWGHRWNKSVGVLELVGRWVGLWFLGMFVVANGKLWADAIRQAGGFRNLFLQ